MIAARGAAVVGGRARASVAETVTEAGAVTESVSVSESVTEAETVTGDAVRGRDHPVAQAGPPPPCQGANPFEPAAELT